MQEQCVTVGRSEPVDRDDDVGQQVGGSDRIDDAVAAVIGGRVTGVEACRRARPPRLGATVSCAIAGLLTAAGGWFTGRSAPLRQLRFSDVCTRETSNTAAVGIVECAQ